jgi:surface carbohydrate biosynthesis protein
MKPSKPLLIIPVENQVRELDAKLLLAVVAAQRGFQSVIGFRREMHFNIHKFPKGIYLSKSITRASELMFGILHGLGHGIVAWDEEALVHLPPDIYYSRRLSPKAMTFVSHFFAWGEDNAELWRRYPQFPQNAEINVTGNPRNDLLRKEIRPYYTEDVKNIRDQFGDFFLINTNFNHINAFSPVQNLFQPVNREGETPKFGRAARGMPREYAEGFQKHKQAVFDGFLKMIPKLQSEFPGQTIVVRPHPTESQDKYLALAANFKHVKVTNEGNVVSWLMATTALIHNGCTTGVESSVIGVPTFSYRPVMNDHFDLGFYNLPNRVSCQCFTFDQLIDKLGEVVSGKGEPASDKERAQLIKRHLAAMDGPLACERIMGVLDRWVSGEGGFPKSSAMGKVYSLTLNAGRNAVKQIKAALPGSYNRPAFQRHRYPPLTLNDVRNRVMRFQHLLGVRRELKIETLLGQFFRLAT